jgi:hypothetical protein
VALAQPRRPRGGGNGEVDFKGEKRSNDTHESTIVPEAKLYREGPGMEAKLFFIGHGLRENRSALIVDTRVTAADGHDQADRRPRDARTARRSRRHGCVR